MLRLFTFWSLLAVGLSVWLGLALASPWAALLGVAVFVVGVLGYFFAERGLVWVLGAKPSGDATLERAYLKACLDLSAKPLPKLFVLPAPLVLFFGLRSWMSSGSVIVSSGALVLLSQEELEQVLRAGVLAARDSGSPTRTWATLLRHWLTLEGDPSPLGFVFRIALGPWMRTLIRASRGGKRPMGEPASRVLAGERGLAQFLGGADLSRFEGVRLD